MKGEDKERGCEEFKGLLRWKGRRKMGDKGGRENGESNDNSTRKPQKIEYKVCVCVAVAGCVCVCVCVCVCMCVAVAVECLG